MEEHLGRNLVGEIESSKIIDKLIEFVVDHSIAYPPTLFFAHFEQVFTHKPVVTELNWMYLRR